jgi:(p)ppGpp synthase/HD superfamily hydrolase
MTMATLQDALIYATKAHKGQIDKAGLPYILHPIQVMLQMNTDEERILALCHDIPEDTNKTPHEVAYDLGMSGEWETWLGVLTHAKSVPYEDYIKQIKLYPTASKVKLADMNHNMLRLNELPEKDRTRLLKKYQQGMKLLIP